MKAKANRRILLVDDNPAIHEDYRKILAGPPKSDASSLNAMESALFGGPASSSGDTARIASGGVFELTSALQGEEAVGLAKKALDAGEPFGVAFVDMRMPPGWDGLETIQRLWAVDPAIQVVICTAYTDRSWGEIRQGLGNSDQLLILKKPFDSIEVLQSACTLSEKWTLTRLANRRMEGLEETVKERTAEALRALRLKNHFLSNVSHELLTPLNGIVGLTESLESTKLDEDQGELVGLLKHCNHTLMTLVRNILDYNDLEASRMKLECVPFDPRGVLGQVEELLAVEVRKKGLVLQCHASADLPESVTGDERRLLQVLSKLAENAVRFTEKGRVDLGIEVVQDSEQDCLLWFYVRDTGVGMSQETRALVLQGFAQADASSTREHGGIGMGLTLCRLLLELLGSALQIDTELGRGSTFGFRVSFPKQLRAEKSVLESGPGMGI